ncbi:MAG TPA: DsrE family protein [Methylomirabilota bacterium]|nr:DsrE family protein [Methylomirabilota bacterium]
MSAYRLAPALLFLASMVVTPARAEDPIKVVYHLNEGIPQAARALGNVRNHLAADPTAKIVVVTHGNGIEFLLKDAKKPSGAAFSNDIEELSLRGVEFRVCQNTLETRKIDPARVVEEGKIVRSGVAEVARLQAREGYVYVRP